MPGRRAPAPGEWQPDAETTAVPLRARVRQNTLSFTDVRGWAVVVDD